MKEKVALLCYPKLVCPECGCELMCNDMDDSIRVKFMHHPYGSTETDEVTGAETWVNMCSRSGLEIIRPKAQFTVYI